MEMMRKQLLELLSIKAPSGEEKPVRDYLKPILEELMNKVFIDDYGNLLAEKVCGTGDGVTVLLSAHMDTVSGVLDDRTLIERDGMITSSKGVLGADDRAGIAIILEVLRNVNNLKDFNGTIKVAFSCAEEIGCVGASKIDLSWYQDVNLAIVVDRRGNRDIVVGNSYMAFCSNEVGKFMEKVSALLEMDWKCVEGGTSDARVFAENGVNAVNLSAGYRNEHTSKEYVVLKDMENTVKIILQALAIINQFADTFGEVPDANRWAGFRYDYFNV